MPEISSREQGLFAYDYNLLNGESDVVLRVNINVDPETNNSIISLKIDKKAVTNEKKTEEVEVINRSFIRLSILFKGLDLDLKIENLDQLEQTTELIASRIFDILKNHSGKLLILQSLIEELSNYSNIFESIKSSLANQICAEFKQNHSSIVKTEDINYLNLIQYSNAITNRILYYIKNLFNTKIMNTYEYGVFTKEAQRLLENLSGNYLNKSTSFKEWVGANKYRIQIVMTHDGKLMCVITNHDHY